ncbi:MAG: ADP-ribosylation factor-directed GTPase activating protein isoform b, partial [Pirellulaceae bacterium]|nr:ADP-ribosylation factor-directed GTPase activating protein isoform b [Pirellulaceae bacterium]
ASWIARDGETYSTELLLASELQQNLETSACGGTHRLIGIAMALNKRRADGEPITGVWAEAAEAIQVAIAIAQQNQNPDGSYSTSYLHRTGWTRDLGESLGTTGHMVEFLAIAASDETLRQPWVQRSVRRLCEILQQCDGVDLECGVLYHALHGLVAYQDRMQSSDTTL